jgi:hypothetical protein
MLTSFLRIKLNSFNSILGLMLEKIGGLFLIGNLAALSLIYAAPTSEYPLRTSLGGVETPYTAEILSLLNAWPPAGLGQWMASANPIALHCFKTEGNDFYIGAGQFQKIAAPIERVTAVLDDFGGYVGIFKDMLKVEVKNRDGNRLITYWEQKIPFPLVPNVKQELIYLLKEQKDANGRRRKIYRYQLKSGSQLTADDGAIVLESHGEKETWYAEFDFFNADWGIVKSFGEKTVWKDSLEGLAQSDLALRLRAEHPEWNKEQVLKKSESMAGDLNFKECFEHRLPWKFYNTPPSGR